MNGLKKTYSRIHHLKEIGAKIVIPSSLGSNHYSHRFHMAMCFQNVKLVSVENTLLRNTRISTSQFLYEYSLDKSHYLHFRSKPKYIAMP